MITTTFDGCAIGTVFTRLECSSIFTRFECSSIFTRFECSFLGTLYYFRVRARNPVGWGPYSTPNKAGYCALPTSVPINLVVVKLHSKRVKMKTTLETSEDQNYTRN